VVIAHIARVALSPSGGPLPPTDDRNQPFSEMAMFVLVRRNAQWRWLAAGQNTPIRPGGAVRAGQLTESPGSEVAQMTSTTCSTRADSPSSPHRRSNTAMRHLCCDAGPSSTVSHQACRPRGRVPLDRPWTAALCDTRLATRGNAAPCCDAGPSSTVSHQACRPRGRVPLDRPWTAALCNTRLATRGNAAPCCDAGPSSTVSHQACRPVWSWSARSSVDGCSSRHPPGYSRKRRTVL
jgi:hypothetical protein